MTLPPDLKNAYVSMFQALNPDIVLCMPTTPGDERSYWAMMKLLKRVDARVSYWALGRNWSKKPFSDRCDWAFVLEHGKSGMHPHWHGFIETPDGDANKYAQLFKEAWTEKTGWPFWFTIQPEEVAKRVSGAAYILKEISPETTDRVIFMNMVRRDGDPNGPQDPSTNRN